MPARLFRNVFFALLLAGAAIELGRTQGSWGLAFAVTFTVLLVGLLILEAIGTEEGEGAATGPERTPTDLPVGFGRALIEKLPSPLVVIEERGRISYANPAATSLLPRLQAGDHFANPLRAPRFIEAVTAIFQDGVERDVQFEVSGLDRVFEAQVALLPPGGDLGAERQIIVMIEDRTEARQMDEMRRDFIANASHELRTPLAAIIGYIETLQGHAKDDEVARERFLGIMERQAGRMHRLVEDLMSLSRIETRGPLLPNEVCELLPLVLEAGTALQPMALKAGTEIVLDLDGGGPVVRGDRDELTQVVTNLIDNAVKYGGVGTVRIHRAKANEKYPGMAGISVADQGPGISQENVHRLTERFYRVEASGDSATSGTGLGLAIVKHVLNRHSGALQIESTVGEGSTFTFWVPVKKDVTAESNAAASTNISNIDQRLKAS